MSFRRFAGIDGTSDFQRDLEASDWMRSRDGAGLMERQIGQNYLDIWSRERLSALKNVRVNVYLNVHVNVHMKVNVYVNVHVII